MENQLLTKLALLLLLSDKPSSEQATTSRAESREQQLEALIAWVEHHLDQPIDLTLLESKAGCSRRTLQYHFRSSYGCTPMQWLRLRRLDRAMARLQQPEPGDSISRVAERCGYTNLAAFSRDFVAQHNRRPSEVLRSSRIEQSKTRN